MKALMYACTLFCCAHLSSYASMPDKTDRITSSQKAYTKFHQQFGDGCRERWEHTRAGSTASFIEDGTRYKVLYSHRGRWLHTIISRNEHHVSKPVAALIAKYYPGYRIILQISVTSQKGDAELVKIENEETCKTVRMANGQIEVIDEFEKA